MDRRKFLCRVTAAGTGAGIGAAAAPPSKAKENAAVTYSVKGFTCITCAVGLEVMLRGFRGVTRATASYPENKVSIGYDSRQVTEKTLKAFIAKCGFSVA
jgi:Cu+-exporting ATPase